MKGAVLRCGGLLALACGLALPVLGEEPGVTDADRSSKAYTRDAATVGDGVLRFELRGMYLQDKDDVDLNLIGFSVEPFEGRAGNEIDRIRGGIIDLLGSYGLGKSAELGFDVPFFIQDTEFDGGDDTSDADMGDVLFYGKFKRMVAKNCAASLGMELTAPTGIEKKGFGTGEVGFTPFLSSRYQRGRLGLDGYVGYQIYTGSPPDVLQYGATAFARGSERLLLRLEFVGRVFRQFNETFNDAMVLPGFDINVTDHITLRPTAMANLTSEATDWGVGLGVAMSFGTKPASVGATE